MTDISGLDYGALYKNGKLTIGGKDAEAIHKILKPAATPQCNLTDPYYHQFECNAQEMMDAAREYSQKNGAPEVHELMSEILCSALVENIVIASKATQTKPPSQVSNGKSLSKP